MSSCEDILQRLHLEKKHVHSEKVELPIIDSHIYTTFGRRLFDLYKKYSIETADQREIESLSFVLTSFTLTRNQPPRSFLKKLLAWFSRGKK
jgi:hypothetical protein